MTHTPYNIVTADIKAVTMDEDEELDFETINTLINLKELLFIRQNIQWWSDPQIEALREFYLESLMIAIDEEDEVSQDNLKLYLSHLSTLEQKPFN